MVVFFIVLVLLILITFIFAILYWIFNRIRMCFIRDIKTAILEANEEAKLKDYYQNTND